MMDMPSHEKQKLVLTAIIAAAITMLFFSRSILLFIPVGFLIIFWLWRKGSGQGSGRFEEDDPADWWKNGKKSRDD